MRPPDPFRAACLFAVIAAGAAETARGDRECGYQCLAVALRTFDPDADAADLKNRLGEPGPEGYSLAELAAAAEAAGAEVAGVSTTLHRLRLRMDASERFAAVAHVDNSHFVLVSDITEDGRVTIIDPPRQYVLPAATFRARWDGVALLVAPAPLTPEEDLNEFPWRTAGLLAAAVCVAVVCGLIWRGRRTVAAAAVAAVCLLGVGCEPPPVPPRPDAAPSTGLSSAPTLEPRDIARPSPRLTVVQTRQDLGEIPVGHEYVARFVLSNEGRVPVTVSDVLTSCTCTGATISTDSLAPGTDAVVEAAVHSRRPERKTAAVTLETDDPNRPTVRLEVAWRAVAPLTPDPLDLDFGALRPGDSVERTLRLVRRDLPGSTPGSPGEASVSPTSRLTVVRTNGTGGLAEWSIVVRLEAPDLAGAGAGTLVIPIEGGWTDALRVPVRWEVRDVVAVKPPAAAIRAAAAGAPARVRVVVVGAGPISMAVPPVWEGPDGWADMTAAILKLTPDRFAVDLSGTLPEAPGRHSGVLWLPVAVRGAAVADEPAVRTLRVPVSAFVLEKPVVADSEAAR